MSDSVTRSANLTAYDFTVESSLFSLLSLSVMLWSYRTVTTLRDERPLFYNCSWRLGAENLPLEVTHQARNQGITEQILPLKIFETFSVVRWNSKITRCNNFSPKSICLLLRLYCVQFSDNISCINELIWLL